MITASIELNMECALSYARLGWHVLPVHAIDEDGYCTCGDADCDSTGKHPRTRTGLSVATTDAETIREWWDKWPGANVGIACRASGLVAIDIDPRHGGDEQFRALEDEYGPLPQTVEALTGGGGRHLLFQDPGGRIKGNLGTGVDLRSNAYIVVAPSLHESGAEYAWAPGQWPGEIGLATVPEEWVELMHKGPSREKGVGSLVLPGPGANGRILDGGRATELTSIAGSLRRVGFTGEQIAQVLVPLNERQCDPPLSQTEVERIAHGMERYAPAVRSFPLTELGNADRLVARHSHELRCVVNHWHVYDGKRWLLDITGAAMRMTCNTVRSMKDETPVQDLESAEKLAKWAVASESKRILDASNALAKTRPQVLMTFDQFDADPMLLNVENGTLDLRTGELREHDRENYITKLAPVAYEPDARCPQFRLFLDRIFDEDQDLIAFIQRAMGYSLTGSVVEQCFVMNYGTGANGKTTFAEIMSSLMGDYAVHADASMIMRRSADATRNDVARLQGARLVHIMELEESARLDVRLLKNITGGDRLTARYLYKEHFEFSSTCKLWIGTNHKPEVGDGEAIWRRVRFIPFEVFIPEAERDPSLLAKLHEEQPGILNWALEGCLAWQAEGLGTTEKVRQATEAYRREEDQIGRFIGDRCLLNTSEWTSSSRLYNVYVQWCKDEGANHLEKIPFARKLGERIELHPRTNDGQRGWQGIEVPFRPERLTETVTR